MNSLFEFTISISYLLNSYDGKERDDKVNKLNEILTTVQELETLKCVFYVKHFASTY